MQCPHCRFSNAPGARECRSCGLKFSSLCICGFSNPLENAFCGRCGARLDASRAERSGGRPSGLGGFADAAGPERRQLTIVFCDLVGSTALSQRLDPEELREILLSYRTLCGEIIGRFGGYIAQYFGDGIMVYFGYPTAHDDDAVMAVRAALEMVTEIRLAHFNQPGDSGITLRARIGVHTGLVVTGELGGDPNTPVDFFGETPNLAARLEQYAAPDTVLISGTTHRLVEDHFECQPIKDIALKGVALPFQAFRVLSERGVPRRPYVVKTSDQIPQINRESEMALLRGEWDQVRARRRASHFYQRRSRDREITPRAGTA